MEILIFIVIVVIFLGLPVMQMRKQNKQVGEIKNFQSQLEPGMVVQMTSGIHGRITSVGPTTVDVEVATGTVTTWDRNAVLKLVTSVEPGTTEADRLTAGNAGTDDSDTPVVPDDLSSLGDFGGADDGTADTVDDVPDDVTDRTTDAARDHDSDHSGDRSTDHGDDGDTRGTTGR
ncbi:preprotein translocase subunit YajC [Corynebacterium nuruki]|jgi:preprotein translocase subunit YajC|uniref:preprotein translocase subunit YajC n=1 Tax=Corynebacterium nuruki TaxID=1032851 RepID=UPI0039BFA0D9